LTHLLWSLNVNYHLPKSKLLNNCPELHKWGHILTLRLLIFILNDPYISMTPSVLLSSCFLLPCYFLHLSFKYFLRHSFPKHPKSSQSRPILHPYNKDKIIVLFLSFFFYSFIMHSVNPYKVNQPIGYRTCHNTSVL
jgi:hypothetical protein